MSANALLHYRIWGGFLAFGLCAAFGLRLLYRGAVNDIYDPSGISIAARLWFTIGAVFCILSLVAYTFFVWRQGYFDS